MPSELVYQSTVTAVANENSNSNKYNIVLVLPKLRRETAHNGLFLATASKINDLNH